MASHLLCASCRGGVESNAALMIEAEVALSDEWKRLSVATQKVYQALGEVWFLIWLAKRYGGIILYTCILVESAVFIYIFVCWFLSLFVFVCLFVCLFVCYLLTFLNIHLCKAPLWSAREKWVVKFGPKDLQHLGRCPLLNAELHVRPKSHTPWDEYNCRFILWVLQSFQKASQGGSPYVM